MMKNTWWLILPLLLIACKNDKSGAAAEDPVPQAETQVQEPTASPQIGQVAPGATPAARNTSAPEADAPEKTEPIIGTRPVQSTVPTGGTLTITGERVAAATGENVCMKVKVADFQEIISMQYSVSWDPGVLSFTGLKDMGLPYLNNNNFGTHRTGEGLLTFVWIDNSLGGINLPDGSTIYQVCFDVKGSTGQSSPFRITDQPTPFEAVNAKEQLVEIVPGEGLVTVN